MSYKAVLWLFGVIVVPDDSLGVTKKFVLFSAHKSLPDGKIIALEGSRLPGGHRAGLHGLCPAVRVDLVKFFTVTADKVGLVEACDGQALPSGHIMAKRVKCDSFQDARAFLEGGGERGPQIDVIPPGTYRINPLLFTVSLADAISVPQGQVGVVEARDGKPIPSGRVIAHQVTCDSYQDGSAFLSGGGERGPQMALIAPGTYRINTLLFDVNIAAIDIPENKVGIVTTARASPSQPGKSPASRSRTTTCSRTPTPSCATAAARDCRSRCSSRGATSSIRVSPPSRSWTWSTSRSRTWAS